MNNVPSAICTVKTPVLPPDEEEDSLGRLYDALIEGWDENEPIYRDASEWPPWTDERIGLCAPLCEEERLDDLAPYEPSQEDVDALLDIIERAEYEAGCMIRFV